MFFFHWHYSFLVALTLIVVVYVASCYPRLIVLFFFLLALILIFSVLAKKSWLGKSSPVWPVQCRVDIKPYLNQSIMPSEVNVKHRQVWCDTRNSRHNFFTSNFLFPWRSVVMSNRWYVAITYIVSLPPPRVDPDVMIQYDVFTTPCLKKKRQWCSKL